MGFPQIFSTPYRRNYTLNPQQFRGARTCWRSSITMPSLVGLGLRVQLSSYATNWRQHKRRSPKNGKNLGFPPTECDRINRSRRNFARKHRLRVYCNIPNLALIGKGGWVQEPPANCENLVEMAIFRRFCPAWATQYTDPD